MNSIIKRFLFYCILQSVVFSIASEEIDFSKTYYNDLSGYHAVGNKNSTDKEEAIRLAKSDAIKRIFAEIGKDELFQQMFISAMPQFIILEGVKTEKLDKAYSATVKLVIDQNAVIMTEEPYTHAVTEIYNKVEKILEEVEKFLHDAENAELNLRMSEALLFYRSAKLRCREIDDLLKNIKDTSIKSAKGNNILILEKMSAGYFTRANDGFSRLEEIETAMEKDSALKESIKIFELLLDEIKNIDLLINQYADLQPFYDLQKSKLENIKIDVVNATEKSRTVNSKLTLLSEQIPAERLLLKEKIDIASDELKQMVMKLNKMKKEVELEIFDPRLVRQQRAQNWNKFLKTMGDTCSYLFLHDSKDILAFRYYLPLEWVVDSNLAFTQNNEFNIRVEKTFSSGFWIKTQFNSKNLLLSNGNLYSSLFQELALGYFRERFIFGAAFIWDWEQKINTMAAAKDVLLKIYFGGVNVNRSRADWLLSFSYQIPEFLDPFFYAYQLNGFLDLLVRIENVLLLETSLSSNALQDSVSIPDTLQFEELLYNFNWRIGFGLRFPGPIVWGIYYNYNLSAPINPLTAAEDFGPSQIKNYWGGYIEYSF